MANPKQLGLFDGIHHTKAEILIRENHELIQLTKIVPWPELMEIAISIRDTKIKSPSGVQPHYRELLGAIALMAVRNVNYRQCEDLIAHYAPARYLCGLMDSTWQPDHITIFEFTQMLGAEGVAQINRVILLKAQELGILDPSSLMSDTTAQEAMIPYPNEVGLMKRYADLVSRNLRGLSGKFTQVKQTVKNSMSKIRGLVRGSHLFAKTKEQKTKIGKKLFHVISSIQQELQESLAKGRQVRTSAGQELKQLSSVMEKLLPQILYFLETGFVAGKKIIHLQMPELYSIVRGKAGKSVEFGLKWGINHIDGFVSGFLINNGKHVSDKVFCLESIRRHLAIFGQAPEIFGFDRGGYSQKNIRMATKMGVKHVGIAPQGKKPWVVSDSMAERIKRERVLVEGVIGTAKSQKYGFNKPRAQSVPAMEMCGHRAFLGLNLIKTLRKINQLQPNMSW